MTGFEPLIAAGLSAASSAVGAISQAQQASAQAGFQEHQANIEKQNAFLAREAAGFAAAGQREQGRRALARQRSNIGRSGLQLAGTPLAVIEDLAVAAETEALTKEFEGEINARGAELRAQEALFRANQTKSGIGAGLLGDFLQIGSGVAGAL